MTRRVIPFLRFPKRRGTASLFRKRPASFALCSGLRPNGTAAIRAEFPAADGGAAGRAEFRSGICFGRSSARNLCRLLQKRLHGGAILLDPSFRVPFGLRAFFRGQLFPCRLRVLLRFFQHFLQLFRTWSCHGSHGSVAPFVGWFVLREQGGGRTRRKAPLAVPVYVSRSPLSIPPAALSASRSWANHHAFSRESDKELCSFSD